MRFGLTTGLFTICAGLMGLGDGSATKRSSAWIDDHVAALQPRPDERRIDQIGWAPEIRAALRLSRDHGRPVFLFTMDGRFSIGRC
jgi:hypothetical protein